MGFFLRRNCCQKVLVPMVTALLFYLLRFMFVIHEKHTASSSVTGQWFMEKRQHRTDNSVDASRLGDALSLDYGARRNTLMKGCAKLPFKPRLYGDEKFKEHMLVGRKHSIVFCGVEKVALTFWRRVFSVLNDIKKISPYEIQAVNAYIPGSVETMANTTEQDFRDILSTSLTVMFTRNPYDRLFSAYVDKFVFPNINYWISRGTGIIRQNRINRDYNALRCGHNVTFSEFVKYAINMARGKEEVDNHFITITEHCRPCQIRYDIIGTMKTLYNDTMFILQHVKHTEMLKQLHDTFHNAYVKDQFTHATDVLFFYKAELVDIHKCVNSFYVAQQRFWRALQLRGLISMDIRYPIPRNGSENISKEQLLKALFSGLDDRKSSNVQKHDAMLDAYASVDMTDLRELRAIFTPDCTYFGYDCSPPKLFNRTGHRRDPVWFLDMDHV